MIPPKSAVIPGYGKIRAAKSTRTARLIAVQVLCTAAAVGIILLFPNLMRGGHDHPIVHPPIQTGDSEETASSAMDSITYPTEQTDPSDETDAPAASIIFKSNGDGTCCITGYTDGYDFSKGLPTVSPAGDTVTSIGDSAV